MVFFIIMCYLHLIYWKLCYVNRKIAKSFVDTAKATARFAPNRVCLYFTFSYHVCTHFAWPSFLKYKHCLFTLSVHTLCFWTFVYTSTLCKCTLASTSLPSVLSANHRIALNYMLCSDWFIKHLMMMMMTMDLNCCLLTQPFCPAERAV